MLRPVFLIAGWIAKGHDQGRAAITRLRPLSLQVALLEEQVRRLTVERELLRGRLERGAPRHRPHDRRAERLDILWHAQRYRLSVVTGQ